MWFVNYESLTLCKWERTAWVWGGCLHTDFAMGPMNRLHRNKQIGQSASHLNSSASSTVSSGYSLTSLIVSQVINYSKCDSELDWTWTPWLIIYRWRHIRMEFGFKVKKLKEYSILHKLRNRETFYCKPNTHPHVVRKFYCNVLPNYTVLDVEKPPCYLRKFSPDGQYFIAFSLDQSSLDIYKFRGKHPHFSHFSTSLDMLCYSLVLTKPF